MPAMQSGVHKLHLLDRSNGQNAVGGTSTPPCAPTPAPLKPTGEGLVQRDALQAENQGAFAHRANFVGSSTVAQDSAECVATGSVGVPCQRNTRLANRSNGPPLATIIEQSSRSTLNSRVSLLSVIEPASPCRVSQKRPRAPNDVELSRIPEQIPSGQDPSTPTEANKGRDVLLTGKNAFHIQARAVPPGNSSESKIANAQHTTSGQRLSSFFRHVLHTVQTTSRPSPLSQKATVQVDDIRPGPTQGSPRSHQRPAHATQPIRDTSSTPRQRNGSIASPTATPLEHSQTRCRKTSSSTGFEMSARADPPLLTALPHESESITVISSVCHLLPPSVATRPHERSASVHSAQQKPREETHNSGPAGVSMLQDQRRSDTPVCYTFEGVSICPGNASSLVPCDRPIEPSRNASFCSTMSTSYSGTVLGVDLDLGHDPFAVQGQHCSRSPTPVATPVWFTPQMGELERQASVSESPEQVSHRRPDTTAHSMKSFALTSLLPIAAASGIVTPNYNTPKISFYSPSGNLIQPDSSSSPGTNSSDFDDTPKNPNKSYYHDSRSTPLCTALPRATCASPTSRPALVPMTTPPIFSNPMPEHLRHHHNYRHPELSQIESTESFVVPAPAVRGCGGMVKSPSFTPRSGTRHQHDKSKSRSGSRHMHNRSTKSIVHNLRFEVNFYKAGLIGKAATCCGPNRNGEILRKRHVANTRTHVGSPSYSQKNSRSATSTMFVEEKGRLPSTSPKPDHSTLGPLAGQALRVCFCQPYDGVGRTTHAAAADMPCMSKSRSAPDGVGVVQAKRTRASSKALDGELPNSRIVDKSRGLFDRGEKKAAVGKPAIRARGRSDGVAAVGP
ncbi:hypothetical protein NX059_008023 [Plenodomus lindquistii]|nr:hypothetical protein NX059_008023 [Plenodomus lindquistii]